MQNNPTQIIVHHTGDSSPAAQFNKTNKWHKIKQFPVSRDGYFCGYHLFIERDGATLRAREDDEIGAHCLGQNDVSIGICLAGNFSVELPTEAQKTALGKVCAMLMAKHNISIIRIVPHRYWRDTECYGSLLPDRWAAYNAVNYQIGIIKKLLSWLKISTQN